MGSFTKGVAAGNRYAFGWFIDDNGFPLGSSTSAPSQGATGSPAVNLEGIKVAAPTSPEQETVPVTGDDELIEEFDFSPTTARSFVIEYATESLAFISAILGTNVVTWGEAKAAIMDIPNAPERNMGFIFQSRAKKRNVGVSGQKGWNGKVVPLASATPLGRASFDERGAATFRMQITPHLAGYDPFGLTILSSNYGAGGGRYIPFFSEYPLTLHTWRGTGAIPTFNTQHRVISVAKTPVYGNRILLTTSSVTPATPSLTLSGNPAGDAVLVSLHEFDQFNAA